MATKLDTGRPSVEAQKSLVTYASNTAQALNNNFNIRARLLERDRAYQREQDFTAKQQQLRQDNRTGKQVAENIILPIVMPQVESATAFLSGIFLSGTPLFPTLGKPEMAPAALQMETAIGDQADRFGWVPEMMMTIRDGLKYNIAAMEVDWATKKIVSISNDTSSASTIDKGKSTETYTQGNYLKHLNMYNVIVDTRVASPARMHIDGEFAGYVELLGRIALKQLFIELGTESTMNARDAFESGSASYASTSSGAAYYLPEVNPSALLTPQNATGTEFNWGTYFGLDKPDGIRYSGMYEVLRLYCRIIPSEHGLTGPGQNTPQIWKLIVINRRVLIYAQRCTNAHNFLGVLFMQPIEDGLGWQTKSFAENVTPLQTTASALYNSGIESQRRKVYDRMLYDPSRVAKQDIDNVSPAARIPVKQLAYGTNLAEAVYQIPYRDDGVAEIFQVARELTEFGNLANGVNRVQQGQFQKGNKTRQEFDTTMGNSDARMQMMALCMEYRFFQPLKEIIKLNILQFQPPATLFNRTISADVKIDPSEIRSASIQFKMADGLTPVDKMLSPENFQLVMQMSQGNPQFGAQYDIIGAFFYYLQIKGASWLNDFKRDPAAQQQFLNNQQALTGATQTATDANGNSVTQPTPVAAVA